MPDQPQADIVQTLRDFCEMGLEGGDADPLIEVMHDIGASAAAEITRLRAENVRLEAALRVVRGICGQNHMNCPGAAQAKASIDAALSPQPETQR